MSNFIQRAITGILFVMVIGAAFVLSPVTYAIVMVCVITLATNEFCRMVRYSDIVIHPHFFIALATNVVAFTLGFLVFFQGFDTRCLLLLVGMAWSVFLVELFTDHPNPIHNIGVTLLCNIYIGMPFALVNLLAFKSGTYNFRPILALFLLSWINDTGAYLCGITMGKHKLYERVSPKKTIEGLIGGVVLTIGASILLHWVAVEMDFCYLPLWFCILSGFIVSIIGTCGDLIESKFKRSVCIKDSGTLLPGHGGILDRFDATLFAIPIISLLYYFFI